MNNTEIRIKSRMLEVENILKNINSMSEDEMDELLKEVNEQSKVVKRRLNMVKLLAGKETSKKSKDDLDSDPIEEFVNKVRDEGYIFREETTQRYDYTKKKMVDHIITYDEVAAFSRQITKDTVPQEKYDEVDLALTKYSSREKHGKMKLNALNNIRLAIKKRKDDEHAAVLEAKGVKNSSIRQLGAELMRDLKIQPVKMIEVKA